MEYQTLTQALEARSTGDGSVTFLDAHGGEHTLSYALLRKRALRLLHYFQSKGIRQGDELVICVASNPALIDGLWACLLGGIVPVPLATGNSKEHRRKVLGVLKALRQPCLLTEKRQLERLGALAQEFDVAPLLASTRTLLIENIAVDEVSGVVHHACPDDVAFIQFSSGSTGSPKGAVLTHRNVLTNICGIRDAAKISANDSVLSWLPLTHDMGMVGFHLLPLTLGIPQIIISTELFARRPLVWLEKASEKRATILGSPNFGYQHTLRALTKTGKTANHTFDLSCVRLIFNGAEPISAKLCADFVTVLAPYGLNAEAVFPVYGLAEATLAVAFPPPGADLAVVHLSRDALRVGDVAKLSPASSDRTLPLVCVGHPINGCALRIIDHDGAALPTGRIGRIQIRGDNVMQGYYGRDALLRDAFSADDWFDTGDLGVYVNGLYIVGRCKDTIIINGQNIHPHDLEQLCADIGGVEQGKIACVGIRCNDAATDSVAMFVQHRGALDSFAPLVLQIRELIAECAGLEVTAVVPIHSLPRTTSGKIQRFVLQENFCNGQYDDTLRALGALVRANGSERKLRLSAIETTLRNICESVITGRQIGVHDSLIDSGADSLALVEIHTGIDARYPQMFEFEDFLDYPTISAMAAFFESKLSCAQEELESFS